MVFDRPPEKERLPQAKELKSLGIKTSAVTRIVWGDFWKQRELDRNMDRDQWRDQGLGL